MGGTGQLELRERFAGRWARGQATPRRGALRGALDETGIVAELCIHIDDVAACIDDPHHHVRVSGYLQIDGLLARAPVAGDGQLYVADPDVGMKRCEYRLRATTADGVPVRVLATAIIRPGRATRAERETLYVRIHSDEQPPVPIGTGIIRGRARERWRRLAARTPAYARWCGFVERELETAMPPVAS